MKYFFYLYSVLVFIWGALFLQIPDDRFHIWFLDVGQGDSIFIKTPRDHQILIDGGPENFVIEELANVMPFFDRSIDLVVLTHPHADHLEGLIDVLMRFEVGGVLLTGAAYKNPTYEEFLKEIYEQDIPIYLAVAGESFAFDDVDIDVIYPIDSALGVHFENINNSSIGLKVTYEDNVIILTGDMEEEAEKELILSGIGDMDSDIFKAGHHGSRTASSASFLNVIRPEIVVIQVGEDNSFDHPHPETLKRFYQADVEKILRNDLDGRIEFVL